MKLSKSNKEKADKRGHVSTEAKAAAAGPRHEANIELDQSSWATIKEEMSWLQNLLEKQVEAWDGQLLDKGELDRQLLQKFVSWAGHRSIFSIADGPGLRHIAVKHEISTLGRSPVFFGLAPPYMQLWRKTWEWAECWSRRNEEDQISESKGFSMIQRRFSKSQRVQIFSHTSYKVWKTGCDRHQLHAVEDGNVLDQLGSRTRWRKPNQEGLLNWSELEEDAFINSRVRSSTEIRNLDAGM